MAREKQFLCCATCVRCVHDDASMKYLYCLGFSLPLAFYDARQLVLAFRVLANAAALPPFAGGGQGIERYIFVRVFSRCAWVFFVLYVYALCSRVSFAAIRTAAQTKHIALSSIARASV